MPIVYTTNRLFTSLFTPFTTINISHFHRMYLQKERRTRSLNEKWIISISTARRTVCQRKPRNPDLLSNFTSCLDIGLPSHTWYIYMTCHDVEDDPQAPYIRHLRNVRHSHQYFRRCVRVTTTVRLATLELAINREHVGASETKVNQLDVVLLNTK